MAETDDIVARLDRLCSPAAEVMSDGERLTDLIRAGQEAASALTSLKAERDRLEKERDEARQIVRDIYWMAIRYADGRQTYAVGLLNDALDKAYSSGWLEHIGSVGDYAYARDGASPEYLTAEARQKLAEAQRDEIGAKLRAAEAAYLLAEHGFVADTTALKRERDEARAECERVTKLLVDTWRYAMTGDPQREIAAHCARIAALEEEAGRG